MWKKPVQNWKNDGKLGTESCVCLKVRMTHKKNAINVKTIYIYNIYDQRNLKYANAQKKEKEKRMTREKKKTAIWITLCDADRSSNTTQNRCQWAQMIEDEKNLTSDENEHAYLCYVLSLISVYCIIIFSNVERGFDVQQAIKKLLHATLSLYRFLFRSNLFSLFLSHSLPVALFRAPLVSNCYCTGTK